MAAPITDLRAKVKSVVTTEFTAEGLVVEDDVLHPSLGQDRARAAVYPEDEREQPRQVQTQTYTVTLQLYRQWTKDVDPEQAVDPAGIEQWVHRVRRALRTQSGSTGQTWFFRPVRVAYPPDPTGNKSRALITITGWSRNPAVVETSA